MTSRAAILAIFILSGAAGLIYEIVWARQLVLVFGNTTQAVSAILTGFFGGMAIGAAVGGRIADRVRSPLRMYGFLELALVVVVLLTPVTFSLIHEAYRGLYPALESTPFLAVARLILAVLALGPATIMMGATFPALVRHLSRSAELSHAFGRLYSANTAGAVAGTLVAGLVLIELFGLGGALAVGASGSAIAGIVALFLAREPATPTSDAVVPPSVAAAARHRLPVATTMRLPLVVAFVSGLTSLGYQVTWTRLLSSGTGGFTYVFTAVLALFLIGIAVGAFLYSGFRLRITNPVRVLVWTQLAVAVLAVVGLVAVIGQPRPLDPTDPVGSIGLLVISAVLVVLPVTIVLGIAFPTASALLPDEASRAGSESGSLLAVNTAGAIIGSLVIPFVLMPIIGSPSIVILLALTNALLGLGLALVDRPRRLPVAGIAALTAVFVIAIATRPGAVAQPNVALIAARGGQLFASDEDEIASVQAGQISFTPELWVAGTSMTLLTVDAKLMTILPLIARPASERALVVAFGMGTSFRSALVAGLRTDVVELVPSVPEMFRHYYPDAARVLADPAGRVVIADGRNHLELSTERFDIIVTDPPPPIESSGAAVISSLEYYEAGREHLTPGGVMMQWVPYGSPEEEFKEHIRTFASVFPSVTVLRGAGGYGIYMLGSNHPIDLDPDTARAILSRPGVLDDLSEAFDSPADSIEGWIDVIDEHTWLTTEQLRAYVGDGPLITDDRPRPEYFLLRRWLGIGP